MNTSEQLDKFAPAYVAFQAAVDHAKKASTNPHFKSRYADLAEVLDTISPDLAKNGLAIVQGPGHFQDGTLSVTTRLLHTSGQWIESTVSTPLQKADPQGVGSAITYMRRYSAAAMCGIAQEDDDAEGAMARKPKAEPVMGKEEASIGIELASLLMDIGNNDVTAEKCKERVRALGLKDKASGVKAYEAAKKQGLMK